MLLEADALEVRLPPEQALSIAKDSIQKKYWRKYEIVEIRLFYTPFWAFNYDIHVEGARGESGRVAMNANTGELNPYVVDLLGKPVRKSKETTADYQCEVDPAAVTLDEAHKVSAVKIAGDLGLKPEAVSTSGFYKVYVPFWRVWVNVKDETYQLDIDSIYGFPLGFERVPFREKTWGEVTTETLQKLKTPKGAAELAGKAAKELGAAAAGKKAQGFWAWLFGSKLGRQIILIVIVLLLAWYLLFARR